MRWMNRLISLFFLFAFLLITVGYYEAFHAVKVLEIYNEPLPIIYPDKQENLIAGQPLVVKIHYCKFTNDIAHVSPELIGVQTKFMTAFISDVDSGCRTSDVQIGSVPLTTVPGTYILKIIFEYRVNSLHVEYKTAQSEPFEVGPGHVIYLP